MKLNQLEMDNTFQNNQYNTVDDEIKHLYNKIKAIKKDLIYWEQLKTKLRTTLNTQWATGSRSTHLWKASFEYAEYITSKPYKKCTDLTNWEAVLTTRLKRLKTQKQMGTNAVKYPYTP